ncbi:hypothetical protein D3C78_1407190 [compost metagenome]
MLCHAVTEENGWRSHDRERNPYHAQQRSYTRPAGQNDTIRVYYAFRCFDANYSISLFPKPGDERLCFQLRTKTAGLIQQGSGGLCRIHCAILNGIMRP